MFKFALNQSVYLIDQSGPVLATITARMWLDGKSSSLIHFPVGFGSGLYSEIRKNEDALVELYVIKCPKQTLTVSDKEIFANHEELLANIAEQLKAADAKAAKEAEVAQGDK